jgi:Domain of unknown function (DUF4160)
MPTVLRNGPYRFFFYAGDGSEPPHIHIEREKNQAKFWLDPIRLQDSRGYSSVELNRIAALVVVYQEQLLRAWNDFFND